MKHIVNIFTVVVLATIIGFTSMFTYLQVKKSQQIDERLVSSLTTQLDTSLIQKVYAKLIVPVDKAK